MSLVQIARLFLFVREVGSPNHGLWVGIFQRFVGINDGDSWCAAFACWVLAIYYGGRDKIPFPATGACEDIHQWAKAHHAIVPRSQAAPGRCLFLYVNDAGHAHHVGFPTTAGAADGIAGNTSPDGQSSDGDGVHEHGLAVSDSHIVIVSLPEAA